MRPILGRLIMGVDWGESAFQARGLWAGRETKRQSLGHCEDQKMFHSSVTTPRLCGVGIALSSLLSGGAYAADLLTKAPPVPYAATDDFWTRPYLLGDLGRTRLKEMGIALSLELGDEAVANATGGTNRQATQAGQLAFHGKFDMAKLAGIHGGLIGI